MTSKQTIINILNKEGEIDNHYCIDRRITTRLGAVIHKLKTEGWDFDTVINHQTKNCNYIVKKQPKGVIHTLDQKRVVDEQPQLELIHIEEKPKKTPYLMGY